VFRKLISIIFLVFLLSGCERANLDSAKAAYEAGDYETAIELLIPLARAGDAQAQSNLGFMYQEGKGIPQDYAEALKWFRKAAVQGNALGQSNLGLMYAEGKGIPQDYAEALKWFRKAAVQGDAQAQFNLGLMYAE